MQRVIFSYIMKDPKFFSTVIPYLTDKLFEKEHLTIYSKIKNFSDDYAKQPTYADIELLINQDSNIDENATEDTIGELKAIKGTTIPTFENAIDQTEKWIKEESLKGAILDSIEIIDKKLPFNPIIEKVEKALAVSFSDDLGTQYIKDWERQFEYYTSEEEMITCSVQTINKAFGGGLRNKTLNCLIGRSGIGKSLFMGHLAADYVKCGHNVLYISAEMSEESLYKRIDANLLDLTMDDMDIALKEDDYHQKVIKFVANHKDSMGKLWIKEYPTGEANKLHIKNYVKDLQLKKGFKADIIVLDYLNIFASCKLPASAAAESYKYIKAVTEEMRALAKELDVAILTATQTNRDGSKKDSKEMDMTATSDSFGIPMTLDSLVAIIQSEDLKEAGQYIIKVLKARNAGNAGMCYKLDVDNKHMRLSDTSGDDEVIPVHVKDTLDYFDQKRKLNSGLDDDGDDKLVIYDKELQFD